MAEITFTIPDEIVPRLAAALRYSLESDFGEDPSPYTDAQVVKFWTKESWKSVTTAVEGSSYYNSVRADIDADYDGIA